MTTNSFAFLVKSPIPIIDTNEDIFNTYTNWFPKAGKIFLIAWGSITNLNLLKKVNPNELPASHWAFLIELIPAFSVALTIFEFELFLIDYPWDWRKKN